MILVTTNFAFFRRLGSGRVSRDTREFGHRWGSDRQRAGALGWDPTWLGSSGQWPALWGVYQGNVRRL